MSERILLVRLSAIGDIVHTMPTAVAIKRARPDWTLDWVVQTNLRPLLHGFAYADRVIEIPRRPGLRDLFRIRKQFHENRYTIALDMQGLFKSARLLALSGARRRLGYYWQREGAWLFSQAVQPAPGKSHVVDHYLAVAEALIGEVEDVDFGLAPTADALSQADELLAPVRKAAEGRKLLAVNLGAGQPDKQWPLEKFARAIELAREVGWEPFVIGGTMDVELAERLQSRCNPPPVSLAGKTGLDTLIAVLARADAHLGGDTGSTHIAVALGKLVACVMGPTRPERSGPYRQLNQVVYREGDAFRDIAPEEVVALLPTV